MAHDLIKCWGGLRGVLFEDPRSLATDLPYLRTVSVSSYLIFSTTTTALEHTLCKTSGSSGTTSRFV